MITTSPATSSRPVARRFRRRWGAAVLLLAVIAILAVTYLGPSAYMAATLTRAERKGVSSDPRALGLPVEIVEFRSAEDRLRLRGWLLPVKGDTGSGKARLIIMVHGRNGVRDDPGIGILPIATALVEAGYSVLMFDLRGHGESEGDRFSLGWYERRDLKGALDWAQARGFSQIGVYGFSMGAATAILTAAEDGRIAAVVEDSGYADLQRLLAVEIPKRSGLPGFYTPGVLLMVRALYGADAGAIHPGRAIGRLGDRPVLILHCQDDQLVPVVNAEQLWLARYGTAGESQRDKIHLFPQAGHVKGYQADPNAYLPLVLHFWATALP